MCLCAFGTTFASQSSKPIIDFVCHWAHLGWGGLAPLLPFGPRSKSTDHLNPVLLDKALSFFRPHEEGATSGSHTEYDVEWISAMMFLKSEFDAHNNSTSCPRYHVFCGADQGLCIGLHEIEENEPASGNAGDLTNSHKAIEDDFVVLAAKGIFNDKSFRTSRTFRYVAFSS